jgi:hypothetical protein
MSENLLYHGANLDILRYVGDESVELIHSGRPFAARPPITSCSGRRGVAHGQF